MAMKTGRTTGWMVAMAATSINLLLGLLYAWSVFKKALVTEWVWDNVNASWPFTASAALFAFMMIFAGRAQDKYGPRIVALLGGMMFGLGLITSGFAKNPWVMTLTFGVIGGIGIGLSYSATTPCAIKWFDASKKGVISGIVVSGVGLAPVYIAPLTATLLKRVGIQPTFVILGTVALILAVLFALMLRNPPAEPLAGVAATTKVARPTSSGASAWRTLLIPQLYVLWLIYLLTATAGLMLIAHMASIAGTQAKWQAGFMLVVVLSAFNALGRIVIGFLSDKIGRKPALVTVFLIQAVNMFIFAQYTTIPTLIIGASVAGLAYGSLFSLMPAITADYFGISNLGLNYGLVFSGWGIAAIIGPVLGGIAANRFGTYNMSYLVSGILLVLGTLLVVLIKPPREYT